MGVLGLTQNIQFKVPPFLGVMLGAAVAVGAAEVVAGLVVDAAIVVEAAVVVTAEGVVAGLVVVDDEDPQLRINEAQINRMVIMMRIFFTGFPPFLFALNFTSL